jgi:hypothetical protein
MTNLQRFDSIRNVLYFPTLCSNQPIGLKLMGFSFETLGMNQGVVFEKKLSTGFK